MKSKDKDLRREEMSGRKLDGSKETACSQHKQYIRLIILVDVRLLLKVEIT